MTENQSNIEEAEDTASTTAVAPEESATDAAMEDEPASSSPTKAGRLADVKEFLQGTSKQVSAKSQQLWMTTLEKLGIGEGSKSAKMDVFVLTEVEALEAIKSMIDEAKDKESEKKLAAKKADDNEAEEQPSKWDFPWTPLQQLKCTLEQLLLAFCKWSREEADDQVKMNITKAFRRLESYVKWMEANHKRLEAPLTTDSITPAARVLGMRLAHTASGHLAWYLDVKQMDIKAIEEKRIPMDDYIRFMVWMTHRVMLDFGAQENGLVLVQDMDQMQFWKQVKTFPMQIGLQMDRLTIGVLPIKVKACYVINGGRWMNGLLSVMKQFMSKKMKQRIITVAPTEAASAEVVAALGGSDFIPKECCELTGTLDEDVVFGLYIKGGTPSRSADSNVVIADEDDDI